jgi:hypothetical protein
MCNTAPNEAGELPHKRVPNSHSQTVKSGQVQIG